jgi:hypothetical protein
MGFASFTKGQKTSESDITEPERRMTRAIGVVALSTVCGAIALGVSVMRGMLVKNSVLCKWYCEIIESLGLLEPPEQTLSRAETSAVAVLSGLFAGLLFCSASPL